MKNKKIKFFIVISRKIFNHKHWKESRTYSKFEALMDIIQSANWELNTPYKYNPVEGEQVDVYRGEFYASIGFLEKRWDWGEGKVRYFLTSLVKDGTIEILKRGGQNVLKLINYDSYNPEKKKNKQGDARSESPENQAAKKGHEQGKKQDLVKGDNERDLHQDLPQDSPQQVNKSKEPNKLNTSNTSLHNYNNSNNLKKKTTDETEYLSEKERGVGVDVNYTELVPEEPEWLKEQYNSFEVPLYLEEDEENQNLLDMEITENLPSSDISKQQLEISDENNMCVMSSEEFINRLLERDDFKSLSDRLKIQYDEMNFWGKMREFSEWITKKQVSEKKILNGTYLKSLETFLEKKWKDFVSRAHEEKHPGNLPSFEEMDLEKNLTKHIKRKHMNEIFDYYQKRCKNEFGRTTSDEELKQLSDGIIEIASKTNVNYTPFFYTHKDVIGIIKQLGKLNPAEVKIEMSRYLQTQIDEFFPPK